MNSVDLLKIHDYLDSHGKNGASLLSIAKETGIKLPLLRKYLSQFSRSFVRIGTASKYRINTFSSIKDHKQYLVAELDENHRKKAELWFGFSLTIFTTLLLTIINLNGL